MNNKFRNIIEELDWRGSLKDYTPGAKEILIKEKIISQNDDVLKSPEPLPEKLPIEPNSKPVLPVSEPISELPTAKPIDLIPKSESKDLGNTFNNPIVV